MAESALSKHYSLLIAAKTSSVERAMITSAWAIETPNEPFAASALPEWYASLEGDLVTLFRKDGKEF